MAKVKATKLVKKFWRHTGGGCSIGGLCDDTYEHQSTKQLMTCITTPVAHFAMPVRVSGPEELKTIAGVTKVRVHTAKKPS